MMPLKADRPHVNTEWGGRKMASDQITCFQDQVWLKDVSEKLDQKMRFIIRKAQGVNYIPYSTVNGEFKPTDINWWTNGFWPAAMWQMYLMTKGDAYREEAVRTEAMLDQALRNFKKLDHDMGFLWLIHSGVRYRLEGNADSFDRLLFTANMLAGRYNPHGFIRAWNNWDQTARREGWAIIDCMMNLPLLYWASRATGDPRFKLIAMSHADTTTKYFVREDGSCNHIVIFDPETGEYLDNPGGQGYASGSSWSRGQAWALYGFTLSYMQSGKAAYLETARRVARYFISQVEGDWLPRCDLRQPAEPILYDDAAGNIAACGLMELAKLVSGIEAENCFRAAFNLLKAMEQRHADWSENVPAIFTKCTSAYHDLPGRHITMDYADYFFIEAVNKLRGEKLLFWYPDQKD